MGDLMSDHIGDHMGDPSGDRTGDHMGAVPPIATVAITTRNYDRRICVAFAPQLRRTKPEVRITTQKKARTRAGWPGGMAAGW